MNSNFNFESALYIKSVSMPLNLQLNGKNADMQGVNCVLTWNSVLRNNRPGLGHKKRKTCFTGATDPLFPIRVFLFQFLVSLLKSCEISQILNKKFG